MEFFEETKGWKFNLADIYAWMIDDGYIFDAVAAGVLLIINSTVPLARLKTIHRCATYAS
jgi:hypothetical protein